MISPSLKELGASSWRELEEGNLRGFLKSTDFLKQAVSPQTLSLRGKETTGCRIGGGVGLMVGPTRHKDITHRTGQK